MKIITLVTIFVLAISSVFAQEYTISYDMKMESDNPTVQAQLGMLQGSTLTIYVKDKNSRIETNMAGIMKNINIIDAKKQKGLFLIDGMLGKFAASIDLKDVDTEIDSSNNLEIKLVDETKEILGYTCKKAIIFLDDETESIYWYTEEIKLDKDAVGKHVNQQIPGLALEYTINQPEINLYFMVNNIQPKVENASKIFSLKIPNGFTEKSIDDVTKMLGNGM